MKQIQFPLSFFNRNRELRRLLGRIANRGQSTALVGEPRVGKTSLLHYLMSGSESNSATVNQGGKLYFTFFDLQTIGEQFTQAKFWEQAFYQLEAEKWFAPDKPLGQAYISCRDGGYSTFMLERLLLKLVEEKIQLVLLLDEFDALLFHPVLNRGEFFGSLRSLASRCDSLALIIASRQSLSALNTSTQELSRTGSPFFNIFEEITLGAFDEKTVQEFLSAHKQLSSGDRKFLAHIAGGHPFFLEAAKSALIVEYEEKTKTDVVRWQHTSERLFEQARHVMDDTWRLWTPEMKQAFVTIALDEMPVILGEKQFDLVSLVDSLADLAPEIRILKSRGFIRDDKQLPGGYAVGGEVMLWWLADQLIIALRSNDELGAWLRSQQWDGTFFKKKEKDQLIKAATAVGGFLKGGVDTFITAAAEGFGKGISGGS